MSPQLRDSIKQNLAKIGPPVLLPGIGLSIGLPELFREPRYNSESENVNELNLLLFSIEQESQRNFSGLDQFLSARNRRLLEYFSVESNPKPENPEAMLAKVRSILALVNNQDDYDFFLRKDVGLVCESYINDLSQRSEDLGPIKDKLVHVVQTLYLNGMQQEIFEQRLRANPAIEALIKTSEESGDALELRAAKAVLDALSLFPAENQMCYLAAVTFSGVADPGERARLLSAVITPQNREVEMLLYKREKGYLSDNENAALEAYLSSPIFR